MADCTPIAALLREAIGFDPASTGGSAFAQMVRAARDCAQECETCVERLRRTPEEFDALSERVLVTETWFFRDREPFLLLEKLASQRKGRKPLRVLSAPCATGEEAYSAAITLLRAGLQPAEFDVHAIDLSKRALEAAAAALYGKASFREQEPDEHFEREGKQFRVAPEIARLVRFERGNLVDPELLASAKPYDAIFCRNALIYLAPEARTAVFANLHRLMAEDGVLLVGHAEVAAAILGGFQPLHHPGAFAFRGASATVAEPQRVQHPRTTTVPSKKKAPAKAKPAPAAPRVPSLAEVRALADNGKLAEANALCDRLLTSVPLAVEPHCLKGLIEQACGHLDASEVWFRKALYLDPMHYESLLHMSLLCDGKGERAAAGIYRQRAQRVSGLEADSRE